MDIDNLTIALATGGKGHLKGNFTLICIYTRDADTPAGEQDASPQSRERSDAKRLLPFADVYAIISISMGNDPRQGSGLQDSTSS